MHECTHEQLSMGNSKNEIKPEKDEEGKKRRGSIYEKVQRASTESAVGLTAARAYPLPDSQLPNQFNIQSIELL